MKSPLLLTIVLLLALGSGSFAADIYDDANGPYIAVHARNLVKWRLWNAEAFNTARRENKPLFILIGYFSNHWDGVMNMETFRNPTVAEMLNKNFVPILVDRERRPDIDAYYMTYMRLVAGGAGWPLAIIAEPDGAPFYGGSFIYPKDEGSSPGLLPNIAKALAIFRDQPDVLRKNRLALAKSFTALDASSNSPASDTQTIKTAVDVMRKNFDETNGGFGRAPKFPNETSLMFFERYDGSHGTDLLHVRRTLDRMAAGGIRDHVNGGFFRYAEDAGWRIPHFEKTLTNNTLMTLVYIDMFRMTGDRHYLDTASDTARYMTGRLYQPGGGFYTSQSGETPAGDGDYYLWSRADLLKALGPEDTEIATGHFGVARTGNFTPEKSALSIHLTVENLAATLKIDPEKMRARIESIKSRMAAAGNERATPEIEKQITASGSALAACALTQLYDVTGMEKYLLMARKTMKFLDDAMTVEGRLRHSFAGGKTGDESYLSDYAFAISAWLNIYESTQNKAGLKRAEELAAVANTLFADHERGGYFNSVAEPFAPFLRRKDYFDNAAPSAISVMAQNLSRLYAHTGNRKYIVDAKNTLSRGTVFASLAPSGVSGYLLVAGGEISQYVLTTGQDTRETDDLLRTILKAPIFNRTVTLVKTVSDAAAYKTVKPGVVPALYVCENFICGQPHTSAEAIRKALETASRRIYSPMR